MNATAIREKPVLFSDPMVRAILDGRKTQTRRPVLAGRVVKAIPELFSITKLHGTLIRCNDDGFVLDTPCGRPSKAMQDRVMRPPWKSGMRLWVRECWGLWDTQPSDGPEGATILYRATEGNLHENRYQLWRPSIHMPRWASRLSLVVNRVWSERVREISEKDALSEGICFKCFDSGCNVIRHAAYPNEPTLRDPSNARDVFKGMWQSLYAGSWDRNDWVWATEFEIERTTNDPA